ncbi:hypothetical protein OfM2_20000 [Lactovum odontotermitis]
MKIFSVIESIYNKAKSYCERLLILVYFICNENPTFADEKQYFEILTDPKVKEMFEANELEIIHY